GTASIQKMTVFIDKLDHLVTKVETGEGTISKLLTDPSLYKNLSDSAMTLSLTLKEMKEAKGSLKLLMEDPSLYNNLVAASSSVESLSRKINESSGTFKKMVEDPALYDRLLAATVSVEEFSGKLSVIADKISKGEGVAGTLLQDKDLAKEIKETVAEMRDLLKDIKGNPKKYFKFSVF
ncbi:MAG TPA: hypothetical protein VEE82_03180, partial [Thermodesulfovibrionales bacterium]|nr:hypothetical protein [Thermodesulfovibrionales bacterium]